MYNIIKINIIKEKYSSVLIVVIAVVGAILIFYFKGGGTSELPSPSPVVLSQAQEKNLLLKSVSKFNANEQMPLSREAVDSADLDENLKLFILPEAQDIRIESFNSAKGRSGFVITYRLLNFYTLISLENTIFQKAVKAGWAVVVGGRMETVAVTDYEFPGYSAQALYEADEQESIKVTITILKK